MRLGTISATSLAKSYGPQVVLRDVSLIVGPGARTGLVGPNGAGKTTLLRMLAGVEIPDAGRVTWSPPSLHVGYLPQEPDATPGESIGDYLARRTGVAGAESAVDRLASELGDDERTAQAYADAVDTYVALGGPDFASRAQATLDEIELQAALTASMDALSPGQAARAALAAVLLSRFDVLLLDEPTNNLDFAGLDRLASFVQSARAGVVVVSHDRAFLDAVVTRIVEIDEHARTVSEYAGSWSDYVAARELAQQQQYAAHGRYVAERGRLTDRLTTQRSWALKGAGKLRRGYPDNDKAQRDFHLNRTEKQASRVRATEKLIDRLEVVDKPWEGWRLDYRLESAPRSGDVVARVTDAVVRRGTFVLGPLSVEIGFGERVAILGPNGSGKTTLLNTLLGRLEPSEGTRWFGPSVVVGELTQERDLLDAGPTLLESFCTAADMLPADARTLLAKFDLRADHISRAPATLSPGERTRAQLAVFMARGVNCLVLDEPTNHLDLEAIEQLEDALEDFPGTLMLVTHDRRLLERVRVTRRIELEGSVG